MKLKWKKAGLLALALGMVLGTSVWTGGGNTANTVEAADEVEITEENFPDLEFRGYVRNLDSNGDGKLSAEEIAAIKTVYLEDKGVSSLKGFEYLTSAIDLRIKGHTIKDLDLSEYTWLEYVDCHDSSTMTSLDVSGCENLRILHCHNNNGVSELAELTLGNHPNLETLDCHNTKISSLDLSGCPNLKTLPVYFNPNLTSLDVSTCSDLEYLYCYENSNLTELTLGTHPNLKDCICYKTQLEKLDLSGYPNLKQVVCNSSKIKELTLGTHPQLTSLIAHENQIKEIDLSGCPELLSFTIFTNELTSLDVSACTKLKLLNCHDNKLTELDLSKCSELNSLSCHWNRLPSLDLSNNDVDGFMGLTTVYENRGQEIDGILYITDDGCYIDIADGLLDKSKVTEVEIGTYDSATGRIDLDDPMEIGDTVTYYYDTNGKMSEKTASAGTPIMSVKVTITVIKDLTIPDEEPTTEELTTTEDPTTEESSVTEDPTTEDATTAPADVTAPSTDEALEAEVNPSDAAAKTGDAALPMVAMMLCMISVGCIVIAKKKKSE